MGSVHNFKERLNKALDDLRSTGVSDENIIIQRHNNGKSLLYGKIPSGETISYTLSSKNRDFILDFDHHIFLKEGVGFAKRYKYICNMIILADYFKKDFDIVMKKDIEQLISLVEQNEKYSIWTKHDYKVTLKKFYQIINGYKKGKYPEIVDWIITTVKKKDMPMTKH
ncbi:MAG: hypothetical protein AABX82_03405, partial [Nanoarchaeota archaeon]